MLRTHRRGVGLFLFFIATLMLAPSVWPQASTGSINGTVRDQSGAVIPSAPVVLRNTATGVASTSRTNGVGYFAFPGMIPGSYRLSVEVAGMEKYEAEVTVRVGYSAVVDPVLKLGQAVTTSVEVTDVTPLVAVDNATMRSSVNRARIEELPMNGRAMGQLMVVLPGVQASVSQNGGYYRPFGMPQYATDALLDGVSIADRDWGNLYFFSTSPGLGGVQEFTVDSNAVSAKNSRPSTIIISSKSGSNQLHGEVRETHRNNSIGLARARQDFYQKAPKLIRNEFGGNAGGPVFIPRIYNGKNRTFWFFNYDGQRLINNSTTNYTVPTPEMRSGDFSGLKDAQGRLYTLYDPRSTGPAPTYLRVPFSDNRIPTSAESPVAKYLFEITPLPTNGVNPLIDSNWWNTTSIRRIFNSWSVRLDHRLSSADQVYFSLLRNANPFNQNTNMPYLNNYSGWRWQVNKVRTASVNWVHIFSPTFFNEVVTGMRYAPADVHPGTGPDLDTTDWFGKLGMPNPFGYKDFPQFSGTGLSRYSITNEVLSSEYEANYTIDDNLTKIYGKHEFTFGLHFRKEQVNLLNIGIGSPSSFTFDTLATALYDAKGSTPTNPLATPYTGHNLGNMFLGVATYQAKLNPNRMYYREQDYALYFQDNYKVTSRLTLNLGLRWEYWRPWREKYNRLVGFDPDDHSVVMGSDFEPLYGSGITVPSVVAAYQALGLKFKSWKDAGLPQNLVYPERKNLGPRLGIAYSALEGRKAFVVRAGYSLSYFNNYVQSWYSSQLSNTPYSATFNYLPNDAAQSPDGLRNYGLRSVPPYVAGVNSSQVINLAQPRGITRGTAQASYFAPHQPIPRVHTWNLTLEKVVMEATVARARYVGSHSSHLNQWYDYNGATPDYIWYATTGQPTPTGDYANVARRFYDQQVLGTVREYRGTGWSNSQALGLELERRSSKGYAFQLSYSMTNALAASGTVSEINQFMPGAVSSDYDERNRHLNYRRDTGIAKHSVQWNWLVELPVGKGKPLLGDSGRLLNTVVGGWQLSGIGTLRSNYFTLPTGNWNITGQPIELYGYKYPIQDCRSGSCIPGYLWWNGYIPANQINSVDSQGRPNGYMGVPANYKPAVTPMIPWGSTTLPANAPANTNISTFWDTNNVWVPMKSGPPQRLNYNTGLHPWRNQYLPGVRQWNVDASLSKVFPLHERVRLRIAADFFNVLNRPNNPNTIGGDGFLNCRNSGLSPRALQLGMLLSW